MSRGMSGALLLLAFVVVATSKWRVVAELHHVVGGDRGWDPDSDLLSWSNHRVFRVGDQIWFTYSVAQGLIAEVESREEYEACDVRNPIKMYNEGLHTVPLEREGIRYFASTDPQNCKTGLKLHLHILPKDHDHHDNAPPVTKIVEAVAPSTPSSAYSLSYHYCHGTILALVLMFFVTMLLA
ncbi:hypothetical protein HN51_003865 [Arachis hypogaea]|uniref:Phytocyanin domain-containing protein n=1 Tax=Arachis hypogaea TaxID=3818 RepID=A0A445DJI5_ARAHY|nr:mavicyanin [Arachis hypogaea]QHO37409.1 Early nodulin-like protein [Arachis hypogaea]RYR63339.1 hypothetical protein Ahy_A04g021138 [Arachis hypogaea]